MTIADHENFTSRTLCGKVIHQPQSNDRQEGGDHYQGKVCSPWAIIEEWGLDFWEGNCLKYLLRRKPGTPRLLDLKKARHYLDKVIERECARERAGLFRQEERT